MELTVIITLSALLLIAYIFDLSAKKTRIPSVILLLVLGFGVGQLMNMLQIPIPNLQPVLPILGTIGLILIVLEGSLELKLHPSKVGLIQKSILGSFIPILLLSFLIAFFFSLISEVPFRTLLINAVPLCIISSAIAIPSANYLSSRNKDFVIYESSLSDIFGVLYFNFLLRNEVLNFEAIGVFTLEMIIIAIISLGAMIGLIFLLNKIDHRIKFMPIILLILMVYAITKAYHLPALLFILFIGLYLGNLELFYNNKWLRNYDIYELKKEVTKFHDLIIEGAFLIRSLFFIIFGFLIAPADIINQDTIVIALMIVGGIFFIRFIQLWGFKLPFRPLLFFGPRGLITILLYVSIPSIFKFELINQSLIIQVILLTAMILMLGLVFFNESNEKEDSKSFPKFN